MLIKDEPHMLQACSEAGVGCTERAPLWEDRHTWVQAFTTNRLGLQRLASCACYFLCVRAQMCAVGLYLLPEEPQSL